jgi:hypothetical protein
MDGPPSDTHDPARCQLTRSASESRLRRNAQVSARRAQRTKQELAAGRSESSLALVTRELGDVKRDAV